MAALVVPAAGLIGGTGGASPLAAAAGAPPGVVGPLVPTVAGSGAVESVPASLPILPEVLTSVPVGDEPVMAAYDPANQYVYVANLISSTVSVLSGTVVVATVNMTANQTAAPDYVAYDAVNQYVYVVDRYDFESGTGAVSVLSGTSVAATVQVGPLPSSATVDAATGDVYVTNSGNNTVTVLSGTHLAQTIPAGTSPWAGAYDPADGWVYVANNGSDNVTVLNGTSLEASVTVGSEPIAVAYDPADASVYVANNGSGNVSVLSGIAPIGAVSVGTNPSFLAYDAAGGAMYCVNENSSNVSILNGTEVAATVPVGLGPVWVAFDPVGPLAFVVDGVGDSVTVLYDDAVLGTVTVGALPTSDLYDPADGYVYVTDSGSSDVSVLAPAFSVTFNETGLASGTSWSVTLGGQPASSAGAAIVFDELPGEYAYTIGVPTGYLLLSSEPGSPLTVLDANQTVEVRFAPVSTAEYAVTFVESGLASNCSRGGGSGWGRASAIGPDWHGGGGGCGCRRQNGTSNLSWSVTLGGATQTTHGTSLTFAEPNGTYAYAIGAPAGYRVTSSLPASPVTVAGANVTVNVTFASGPPALSITFEEQGLPWGTTWCVNLTAPACTSGRTLLFANLTADTYSFAVGAVSGYRAQPANGTVPLTDRDVVVQVRFTLLGHGGCGGGGTWGVGSPSVAARSVRAA